MDNRTWHTKCEDCCEGWNEVLWGQKSSIEMMIHGQRFDYFGHECLDVEIIMLSETEFIANRTDYGGLIHFKLMRPREDVK